jgi:hypothetical protein
MEGLAKPVGDDQLAFGGKLCRAHAESLTWLTLGFKGFFAGLGGAPVHDHVWKKTAKRRD